MPTGDGADAVNECGLFAQAVDTTRPNIAPPTAQRPNGCSPSIPSCGNARGNWQFLGIGSGLPTAQNTHEIAQGVDPACRVVYVDYDPVVVSHAKALLTGDTVAALQGDLRDTAGILADAA